MTLKRDDIKNLNDLKMEELFVDEWNDTVYVRELDGEERNNYEAFLIEMANSPKKVHKMDEARARLVSLSVCDENGKRLFTEDDIPWLKRKNAKALMRIYGKAQKLSVISQAEIDRKVEELQENPTAGSASD